MRGASSTFKYATSDATTFEVDSVVRSTGTWYVSAISMKSLPGSIPRETITAGGFRDR